MKPLLHNSDVIYPELSYSIVGAAMDVHNALMPGWHERDYHRAMVVALEKRGHVVCSHDRKKLIYRSEVIDRFELDLLVDDLAILELKHLKEGFHPSNYTQVINYLKCWGKRLGMLINFGQEQLRYKRVPYSEQVVCVQSAGNWDSIDSQLSGLVRQAVDNILSGMGSGYSAEVFSRLLSTELNYLGASCRCAVLVPEFDAHQYEAREVDALIVDGRLMIRVAASPSASDLSYLKTYKSLAGITDGILVGLSASELLLRGVR